MEKNKSPVLTSPWKIGFLVSLMLVLLSIGVNYILTRTFQVSWNWLTVEHSRWDFHMNSFAREMFPQLSLVALLSLIAYFLVTSAVRKYKAYLDSGLDYRNLMETIKTIEDLDDEEKIKRVDGYPELKEFFSRIRERVESKEKELEDKENDLKSRARKKSPLLKKDCNKLVEFIRRSVALEKGFEKALGLEDPLVIRLAEAVSDLPLQGGMKWGDEEKNKLRELSEELSEAGDYLKSRLEGITGELVESSAVARKLEEQLAALNTRVKAESSIDAGNWNLEALKNITESSSLMDKLSDSMRDLSEEAKSIAISTALQAGSGEGTLADLIQLAEDVKNIADKFERSADSYNSITRDVRKSVSVLEEQARKIKPSLSGDAAAAINTIASKMTVWVDRVIVLSDRIKTLKKAYNLSFKTLEEKINGYIADREHRDETKAPELERGSIEIKSDDSTGSEEVQFERQELVSPLFNHAASSGGDKKDAEAKRPPSGQDEQKLKKTLESKASGMPEGAVKEDFGLKDIERESENIFKEKSTEGEELFAEITEKVKVGDERTEAAKTPGSSDDAGIPGGHRKVDMDDHEDFTALDLEKVDPSKAKVPEELKKSPYEEVIEDTEEKVIDLYELGAVDYVGEHTKS